MNFLQLAQRLRRKCRVAGSGPTSVTGQNEEYSRLIDWIQESWMEIQMLHEQHWLFMRASCSAATINGQAAYGPTEFGITDLGRFVLDYENGDTFRCYNTAQGVTSETFMSVIDYDDWRDRFLFGALRNAFLRPDSVAVGPDGKLYCGPIPSAGWTITGDYIRVPTELVATTDVPTLPVQYHMAIIYKAMMLYGASEAAEEVYVDGKNRFDPMLRRIERTQLPRVRLAGALA